MDVGLAGEELPEAGRTSAQGNDARRDAGGLGADRDHHGPLRLGQHHLCVASFGSAERAELVAGDEDLADGDAARLRQLLEGPAHRVRLVGQSHLDVLDVAGESRIHQPFLARDALREPQDLRNAAGDAGLAEPILDLIAKLADLRLGRVAPFGQRDEVDLPPVQAIEDDADLEPEAPGQVLPHGFGDLAEEAVFGGARLPALKQHGLSLQVEAGGLRSAVRQHEEAPLPGTPDPGAKLPVDVAEVGPADDHDEEVQVQEPLQEVAGRAGVFAPVRDGGAVPIKHQDPQGLLERPGKRSAGIRNAGHGRRCCFQVHVHRSPKRPLATAGEHNGR